MWDFVTSDLDTKIFFEAPCRRLGVFLCYGTGYCGGGRKQINHCNRRLDRSRAPMSPSSSPLITPNGRDPVVHHSSWASSDPGYSCSGSDKYCGCHLYPSRACKSYVAAREVGVNVHDRTESKKDQPPSPDCHHYVQAYIEH